MTEPIYLALAFHNHQPVGQFSYVTEHSTHVSYLPLIEALEHHPKVRVALHYSGALLEWLKHNQREMLERLRVLVAAGQVELLSGGYYEPILAIIPDEDKIGQIEKLNDELETLFGITPSGMWLAERIWEPHLAKAIAQAALRYVILDDAHFEAAGFESGPAMFGYYITEEQGHPLAVFSSLRHLRYAIPWQPVESVLEWLREQARRPSRSQAPRLLLMADNGEKFGTYAGAYEYCWGEGRYMEDFFTALEMNAEWLKTITPSQYLGRFPPLGRAYLPATSYTEMGIWSLLSDNGQRLSELRQQIERERRADQLRFLHGGIWRNFLVKYDEVNLLHKRVLMVSRKVHAMRRGRKRDRALERLWAAQCNDAYWHGLSGGVYLFNLRVANYANLIAAEDAAESEEHELRLQTFDLDQDGHDDIVLLGSPLSAVWSPSHGGGMVELDFRPAAYNLYNVMTRRKESYHARLRQAAAEGTIILPTSPTPPESELLYSRIVRAKEVGLEQRLIYDWHRRCAFLDHFLSSSTTLEEFYRAQYAEQGNFVNQPYQIVEAVCDGMHACVTLQRAGSVWVGETAHPINIRKAFQFFHSENTFKVHYTLSSHAKQPLELHFGIELVVGFDGAQDIANGALRLNGESERLPLSALCELAGVTQYSADTVLHNLTLLTTLSRPAFLWQFPLETVTLSNDGFERGYQGTVFLHLWHLQIEPNERWEVTLTQSVSQTATQL
ncbi:MAG: alpha-amylase/4-alpha-glucanotransferase domain-containing protein [Aggregatilineales bacterium]